MLHPVKIKMYLLSLFVGDAEPIRSRRLRVRVPRMCTKMPTPGAEYFFGRCAKKEVLATGIPFDATPKRFLASGASYGGGFPQWI